MRTIYEFVFPWLEGTHVDKHTFLLIVLYEEYRESNVYKGNREILQPHKHSQIRACKCAAISFA